MLKSSCRKKTQTSLVKVERIDYEIQLLQTNWTNTENEINKKVFWFQNAVKLFLLERYFQIFKIWSFFQKVYCNAYGISHTWEAFRLISIA